MTLKTSLDLILFGVIAIAILIALIYSVWAWTKTLGAARPQIKLKDFIKLYNMDKSKWNVGENTPRYWKNNDNSCFGGAYYYFKFNYIDFYRYKLWKRRLNKQHSKDFQREIYENALKALNADMQQMSQKNGVEIKLDNKDPRVKALAKDIVSYWNESRKEK